jgi:hypothetical protein
MINSKSWIKPQPEDVSLIGDLMLGLCRYPGVRKTGQASG